MKKLPKGIREKNGSYEARASVRGTKICLHDKDLSKLMEEFEKAKKAAAGGMKTGTVDEWFDEWTSSVKSKSIRKHSVVTMKQLYRRTFGFYLGMEKLQDVTPLRIQKAMDAMQANDISVSSIRRAFSNFRECIGFAVDNNMLDRNPCLAVVPPWNSKRAKKELPLSIEEQKLFLEEAVSSNSWYKEMFYVMLLTGLRVGEVGALDWSSIDFIKKRIFVKASLHSQYEDGKRSVFISDPKTSNSFRYIPFVGEVEEMLISQKQKVQKRKNELGDRWRCEFEEDLVFVSSLGSVCTRYVVQKAINSITKSINDRRLLESLKGNGVYSPFRHLHPHLFRHTFCTRCFEAGMDPKIVQELMGHSTIGLTLDVYTHVMGDKMDDEIKKLGDNLSDKGISSRTTT